MSDTGQSTVEYALMIGVLAFALIGMAVYLKRSLSGKWRTAADSFGQGRQYEHGVTVQSGN